MSDLNYEDFKIYRYGNQAMLQIGQSAEPIPDPAADLLERLLRDRNFWWQQCNIAVENGRKLRSRAEELEAIFRHTHSSIGQPMGNDTCTECGLDLRDPIHRRAGEE